jgi:hypothetical protein
MPHHPQTEEVSVPRTRPIHRQGLACALACVILAAVAVNAPAATPQDLRSPDAHALAQERYYSSYGEPAQDLRSPDARDVGSPVAAITPARVATTDDGIAPLPFVLALAGAVIVGIGLSTAVRTRRRVAA